MLSFQNSSWQVFMNQFASIKLQNIMQERKLRTQLSRDLSPALASAIVWMLFHLYLVLSPEKKVIMQYLLNISYWLPSN
jgi:hypothetical protein